MTLRTVLGFLLLLQLLACTSHYLVNSPIVSTESVEPFSLKDKSDSRSDELLLILTFSGGGTRAAAFAYGVLQTLAETQIVANGQYRRLLDEVDVISSVSGGSFTAAYYGLFQDRIFEDFESKFLKRNVQSELIWRILSPFSWPKLASLYYDRTDLAADYYDELLFEKKTFQDFINVKSPLIAINTTNVALGTQFTFVGPQFLTICSDLSSYPVSRAVTASSAVPGAFGSIILKNYAGSCNYQLPEWVNDALDKRMVGTRRYHIGKLLSTYQDTNAHPFIHLLDGGISDNLGIRPIINGVKVEGDIWKRFKNLDLEETNKMAIIVVNAQPAIDTEFAKRDYSIPILDSIGASSSIPLDQYSYETMELLRNNMSRWREEISAGLCGEEPPLKEMKEQDNSGTTPACAAQTYLIDVNFDRLKDESESEHLKRLPTSFRLKAGDIDRLKDAAKKILTESADFNRLVDDMQ